MASYYWDACVLLAYVNGEPARLPDLDAILDAADKGTTELFTSTLSIVEVAYAKEEEDNGTLDAAVDASIDALWAPKSPVKRIEFHTLIANAARQIVRDSKAKGWVIKPPDAIHLATAMSLQIDEFHTYEGADARKRWQTVTGLTVCEPLAQQPKLTPS